MGRTVAHAFEDVRPSPGRARRLKACRLRRLSVSICPLLWRSTCLYLPVSTCVWPAVCVVQCFLSHSGGSLLLCVLNPRKVRAGDACVLLDPEATNSNSSISSNSNSSKEASLANLLPKRLLKLSWKASSSRLPNAAILWQNCSPMARKRTYEWGIM